MPYTLLQILYLTAFTILDAKEPSDCFPVFHSAKEFEAFHQSHCQTSYTDGVKLKGFISLNKLLYKEQEYVLTDLWGFMKGNVVYRAHKGSLYRIIDYGPIIIYRGIMQRKHAVFFSTDLDTEIYWFSKNILIRELQNISSSYATLVDNLPRNDLLAYFEDEDHFLINILLSLEKK
jgi:hypothetical protein